jgi:membrane-associated phospholipid phosphatase
MSVFSPTVVASAIGVVFTVCVSGVAHAADPETPESDVAATPTATPPGDSTVASPAPGASPSKIEQAKEQAQVAEPTPIVPSPENPTRPAFQLYAELDLPIVGIGAVILSARFLRTQKAYCAPRCDPAELNSLDRKTAGYYSTGWSSASDLGLYGIIGGVVTLLTVDEGALDALNDLVVVAESTLSATAVSSVMTLAEGRPRPLLYGDKAPLSVRNDADAGLSFLSSHASVSFALATSTFMTMKRLHPRSALPYVVFAVGGAAATFVATSRVMAGKHFITDAVGGAIVGTSVGVLVPALHGSPVKLVPVVQKGERGIALLATF